MKFVYSAIRIIFLSLFVFLIITEKHSIWLLIFAASLILTFFFGRFYCGYICPMNTLMKVSEWISKKIGIQTDKVPKWLDSGKVSWILLFVSVVGMISIKKFFSVDIPILLILLFLSVLVTLRYKPAVFHNKICPFGALFTVVGKFSKYSKRVNMETCIGCKLCEKVCPSESIIVTNKKAKINTKLCFQCTNCQEVCPTDAISYKRTR